MRTGVKLSSLDNQKTSDNVDICASGWLGVMLSDYIWVSLITSKYVNWRQRISHWGAIPIPSISLLSSLLLLAIFALI